MDERLRGRRLGEERRAGIGLGFHPGTGFVSLRLRAKGCDADELIRPLICRPSAQGAPFVIDPFNHPKSEKKFTTFNGCGEKWENKNYCLTASDG